MLRENVLLILWKWKMRLIIKVTRKRLCLHIKGDMKYDVENRIECGIGS